MRRLIVDAISFATLANLEATAPYASGIARHQEPSRSSADPRASHAFAASLAAIDPAEKQPFQSMTMGSSQSAGALGTVHRENFAVTVVSKVPSATLVCACESIVSDVTGNPVHALRRPNHSCDTSVASLV